MQPILAIVGRPNVGKSRLFNRIVGKNKAIVADEAGVTRDRHYGHAQWNGHDFRVIDTGGLDMDTEVRLDKHISDQSIKAIHEADVIVALFDGQVDPSAADLDIVRELRKVPTPIFFTVNKVDTVTHLGRENSYYELGVDKLYPVSAEHGLGLADLLDEIVQVFSKPEDVTDSTDQPCTISIIGKPNVGKSTLLNRFAGEDRVITDNQAGTTRDAIDIELEFAGKKYIFIDTAGVNRRFQVRERLEKCTAIRSLKVIDRSQIVIQLIDAMEGLTKQDLHLAGYIREQGRGSLFLINKWDQINMPWDECERELRKGMGELYDLPMMPISAKTGYNCLQIFKELGKLYKALSTRLSTSQLNEIIDNALTAHHLPVHRGRSVQIKYATQVNILPPTVCVFSNFPKAIPEHYKRYLKKHIIEAIGLPGIPVRLICKRK